MFRDMRRKKQALSAVETVAILKTCTAGVLALTGDDGYPYAVPLSFAYFEGKLFFHLAQEGHKVDSLARNSRVSFCVIDKDEIVQETFTTHYRSVIVFGLARFVQDPAEKKAALEHLVAKYSPDYLAEGKDVIQRTLDKVCIVEVTIQHMTGKTAIELINGKEG